MFKFYIVTSGGFYGHFGKGTTLEAATKAWRKAGGRKKEGNVREIVFTSDLPFAPFDRAALETEAGAWIGRDGSLNWIRCTREEPEEVNPEQEGMARRAAVMGSDFLDHDHSMNH